MATNLICNNCGNVITGRNVLDIQFTCTSIKLTDNDIESNTMITCVVNCPNCGKGFLAKTDLKLTSDDLFQNAVFENIE